MTRVNIHEPRGGWAPMASSNPIFKEEDLAALEEETEKAAALAKATRRATNLNIFITWSGINL
jgi:hypothetical protein